MRSPRTAAKSSPHSLQLEKARAKQRRPNSAKKKKKTDGKPSFILRQFSHTHTTAGLLFKQIFLGYFSDNLHFKEGP